MKKIACPSTAGCLIFASDKNKNLLRPDDEPPRAEWIVTFGDMMSLLLTFFVMLVAVSEIHPAGSLQSVVASLRQRFGSDSARESPRRQTKPVPSDAEHSRRPGDAALPQPPRSGAQALLVGVIPFAAGQSALTAEERKNMERIAELLAGKFYKIELRGHAAPPVPRENQRSEDAWNLAYRRSRAAMHALTALGIDPRRIRLTVAGQHEPARPGLHPLGCPAADRVEVFLLQQRIEPQRDARP